MKESQRLESPGIWQPVTVSGSCALSAWRAAIGGVLADRCGAAAAAGVGRAAGDLPGSCWSGWLVQTCVGGGA
jgi:hypothetical protein